jgi:hypothetical protein
MTKKQRILVFTFAGVMALAGIGVFAYIMYVSINDVIKPKASPAEDRKLVVTAERLQEFGAGEIVFENEKYHSQKTFDGTRTVEYSYNDHSGSKEGTQLYLSSTAQVFPQSLSTMQMFRVQQLAIKGGLSFAGDTTTVPAPALLTAGDDRYAAVLKRKTTGEPVGNLFIVRQGRSMLTVIVIGIKFDDAASVEKLLGPALAEARRRFVKR